MTKARFVILKNEHESDHKSWEQACKRFDKQVQFRTADLTKDDWLEEVQKEEFDYLLAKPGGISSRMKELYDERIRILTSELDYNVFPSKKEIYIYENKRYLSFWLKANKIPHPETHVFYNKSEAFEFLKGTPFPIVAKLNIGASGKGVEVLRNYREATKYVQGLFSKGKSSITGPRLNKGKLLHRVLKKIAEPNGLKERISTYKAIATNKQYGFVLFQEFIPHEFEWRVVRIGGSFFVHKKIVKGSFASGSLDKGYESAPLKILSFAKRITDTHELYSQAIDIFEYPKERYLVNEMQCIFGQSDPYQMLINGSPGRYVIMNGKWTFEGGDFAKHACFDLRIEYLLAKLQNNLS